MFIFLSITFALSNTSETFVFAGSFVFFFVLADLLERGMKHKRLPIAISSVLLTVGIFLFLMEISGRIYFNIKAVINLAFFYLTLILAVTYRITQRNPFLGIRTSFTLSSDEAWQTTHEIASKLLFFSLFFYLFVLATTDFILFHFCFFLLNLLLNALASLWLGKQFLKK